MNIPDTTGHQMTVIVIVKKTLISVFFMRYSVFITKLHERNLQI